MALCAMCDCEQDMEVLSAFNVVLQVPKLKEAQTRTVLKALGAFSPDEVVALSGWCRLG